MIKYLTILFLVISLLQAGILKSQTTERPRPEAWKQLVKGGAFKDRFLPMPKGKLSEDTWGGRNVLPRYVDNGIEDRTRSYWGGNIVKGSDSLYHLLVCGWLESSPKGHHEWPKSIVYNTVSKNPIGPFTIKDTIGSGHNPEVFQLKDGRYVLYVIDKNYVANDINGPWTQGKFTFDSRDRPIIEGLSNLTFAKREDGSIMMVCRGGGVWFSETGLSPYNQITDKRVYPPVKGEFEDPVIWKDRVQYHLIVNDWYGRIAFYERSKDGVHWVVDPGEAYVPGIACHEDGRVEDWFKFERIKIFQDAYGRAIQANFAVIDTLKDEDKPNDRHSSKNIGIPLNPGVLISMMNKELPAAKTKTLKIKIAAEPGFDPQKDIDIQSLRFGASTEVNFGRGAAAVKTEKSGKDLMVTFSGQDGLTPDEFAPKLIGKYKSGKMLFGFCRVPWVKYDDAILSARKPVFTAKDDKLSVEIPVENFGLSASKKSSLQLRYKNGSSVETVATYSVPAIQPYGKTSVSSSIKNIFEKDKTYDFSIVILTEGKAVSVFDFQENPAD